MLCRYYREGKKECRSNPYVRSSHFNEKNRRAIRTVFGIKKVLRLAKGVK